MSSNFMFWKQSSLEGERSKVLVIEKSVHVAHIISRNSTHLNTYQELVRLEPHHLWVIHIWKFEKYKLPLKIFIGEVGYYPFLFPSWDVCAVVYWGLS